jgi:hypothetical protein
MSHVHIVEEYEEAGTTRRLGGVRSIHELSRP